MTKKISSLIIISFLFLIVTQNALAQEWVKTLPAKPVTAQPLDKVWSTIPDASSEMANVGIYEVDSVQGNTATLKDGIGTSYPNIPAAVIHPVGDPTKLKVGDVAMGYAWGASKVIGRVKAAEAGQLTLRYQWSSSFTDKMMDHAEPLVAGVAPMAWVVYRNSMNMPYKGLAIAVEGDSVWISTDSGHVEVSPKAKVRPLVIGATQFKAGDVVQAYSWGYGYQPATVVKVVEPGLVYSVKIAGKDEVKDYSFADLASKI